MSNTQVDEQIETRIITLLSNSGVMVGSTEVEEVNAIMQLVRDRESHKGTEEPTSYLVQPKLELEVIIDDARKSAGKKSTEAREAYMEGWHAGRSSSSSPDIQYGYSVNNDTTRKGTGEGETLDDQIKTMLASLNIESDNGKYWINGTVWHLQDRDQYTAAARIDELDGLESVRNNTYTSSAAKNSAIAGYITRRYKKLSELTNKDSQP